VEENRRVELYTDNPLILKPVLTADTLRQTAPPAIRFHPSVESEAGISRWHLAARQDGQLLKEFRGEGAVPEALDWQVESEQETVPKAPGEITYELTVHDRSGQQVVSATGRLPIEQVTVRRKRQDRIADVATERYTLILFDYDRSGLSAEHQALVSDIRSRISTESRVTVVGHADRVGDAAHNQELAYERARTVAAALDLPEDQVEVRGETTPIYDQTLPEGRFNSRSVTIVIENDVVTDESG
jgi:outer membrane protein OmpA-like peptidoglycan-associated protein